MVALTIIAIVLKNQKSKGIYPPVVDNCPDYWYSSYYDIDTTNTVSTVKNPCTYTQYGCCPDNITNKSDEMGSSCPIAKCYNVQNLGEKGDTCNPVMDFSKFTTCQKQTWSKKCNITWDGITNMPDKC
jgi:hypothetical protein